MWLKSHMLMALAASVVSVGLMAASETRADDNRLVVYSALPTIDKLIDRFADENQGLSLEVVRGSSGELLARTVAEAASPQADVIWVGGDLSQSHPQLFETYISPSSEELAETYKSVLGLASPTHASYDLITYNKRLVPEADIPRNWTDLADPKWKGKIYMANPATSSAAYLIVANWLEIGGWDLVEKIAANLIVTEGSIDAPRAVANGEAPIGLTVEVGAYLFLADHPDMGIVYPEDGIMWSLTSQYLIKNGPNQANGKKFLDWMLSTKTQQVMAEEFGAGTRPSNKNVTPPNMRPLEELKVLGFPADANEHKAEYLSKWKDIITSVQ